MPAFFDPIVDRQVRVRGKRQEALLTLILQQAAYQSQILYEISQQLKTIAEQNRPAAR
jgi:hypothetical protein